MLLTLFGCDLLGSDDASEFVTSAVIVANGGNFGDQNGTITTYDPMTGSVSHSPPLNGFLQSITVHEGLLYALLNTFSMGRIDVLSLSSMSTISQINNLPAPRAMIVHEGLAYITNLQFGVPGSVVPVALASNQIRSAIAVGEIPEGISEINGKIFVANNGNLGSGRALSVFRPGEETAKFLDVECDGPRDLFPDNDGEMAILCTGKTIYNEDFTEIVLVTNGAILFLDVQSEEIVSRIDLNTQLGATNGTTAGYFDTRSGELYAISGEANTIYRIDTSTNSLETTMQIEPAGGLIGISGIAYDPVSELLYVGRFPKSSGGSFPDFTAAGSVVILDRGGVEQSRFEVGPAPSQIILLTDEAE